jgi:hypothetical protein
MRAEDGRRKREGAIAITVSSVNKVGAIASDIKLEVSHFKVFP